MSASRLILVGEEALSRHVSSLKTLRSRHLMVPCWPFIMRRKSDVTPTIPGLHSSCIRYLGIALYHSRLSDSLCVTPGARAATFPVAYEKEWFFLIALVVTANPLERAGIEPALSRASIRCFSAITSMNVYVRHFIPSGRGYFSLEICPPTSCAGALRYSPTRLSFTRGKSRRSSLGDALLFRARLASPATNFLLDVHRSRYS